MTLLFALFCIPSADAQQAQGRQAETQSGGPISWDVTIIIQQGRIRFTVQRANQAMRLQIFDGAGEAVFDSGATAEAEIDWPMQDADGTPVRSGLYAYTLTTRDAGGGPERARRGHFIVDRAKDRDGLADRLWVTSQNDAGLGADLTIAQGEADTVAGASTPGGQSPGRESGEKRHTLGRADESELKSEPNAPKAAMAAGISGAAGYLAKFTSATDLGVASIFDLGGKVGIGTTTPGYKLHLAGHTTYDWPIIKLQNLDGGGHSYWLYGGANGSPGDFGIYDETAQAYRFYLNGSGNIGVGAVASLSSKLTLEGQDALTARGYEPFLTLQDSNVIGGLGGSHRIQSAHGDLNFFQGPYLTGSGVSAQKIFLPVMTIKDGGNVGVGTAYPGTKLHVSADEARLRLQSSNSNLWTVTEYVTDARQWHTGVGGSTVSNGLNSKYYIYDATAGKTRLTIDTNGLVGVDALQINGGSDFSENFDVNPAAPGAEAGATKIEAGMVVSIDPANPGKLALSARPYDRRVAGVISGAGGVKPGMRMSQPGTLADGQQPVALSGRVYCWVDASQGAIEPGDLLTTSNKPGFAMKATDAARAHGAILGKAMTGLKEGRGLALVLVTLE
jgi:hypothetical protein